LESYEREVDSVDLDIAAEAVELEIDLAVPCGLMEISAACAGEIVLYSPAPASICCQWTSAFLMRSAWFCSHFFWMRWS
jgi:hypothetical protein